MMLGASLSNWEANLPLPSPPPSFPSPSPSLPLEVGPLKYSYGTWGSTVSSSAGSGAFGAF